MATQHAESASDHPDTVCVPTRCEQTEVFTDNARLQVDGAKGRDFKRLLTMRLQRVESSELIEFPENEEGYLGKIRWYSLPSSPCLTYATNVIICGLVWEHKISVYLCMCASSNKQT